MGQTYRDPIYRVTIPDLCILCPKETRWGQYVYVDDSRFFVYSKCIKWTRDNDADLERLVREQVGETQ